jgi:hypothetical protein
MPARKGEWELVRRIARSRPSPAIVIAVLALVAALAGTAVAGPGAGTSVSKKKTKQIAKKQANKEITVRAPGLSVANAQNAVNAQSAATAANGATGYGNFSPNGAVQGQAFNMDNLAVSPTRPYIYCEDQAFKTVVASGGINPSGDAGGVSAISRQQLADVGMTPADSGCPANTEWVYATFAETGPAGFTPSYFRVVGF